MALPQDRSAQPLSHFRQELARAQWLLRGRTAPGQSSAALRQRAYQQKMQMRATRVTPRSQAGAITVFPRDLNTTDWSPLGPAPLCSDATGADQNCNGGQQNYNWVSGRATAVAIDPSDTSGNTVYVGGAQGGLWKSTNGGPMCSDPSTVSWNAPAGSLPGCGGSAQSSSASLIDSLPSLAVGAIAIGNPNGQNVLLVGTGETNSSADSYYGQGILRSLDGGHTWTQITQDAAKTHPFTGAGFSQIAFSTINPSLVVAATAGASQGLIDGLESAAESNLGLYYSTNAGQTWSYATITDSGTPVGPASVTAVVFNPAYNNNVGAFFAAVRFHGFFVSADGVRWTRLPQQPGFLLPSSACPATPALSSCPFYRGALAVVPGRNEMYAWFVDANDIDGNLWQTLDGGATWKQVGETGLTDCGDLFGGCGTQDGSYNLTLAAVPDGDFTDIYAGAVNLFKCRLPSGQKGNLIACFNGGFLNLTHVYGCDPLGAPARMHPSQHAIDFLPVSGGQQVVMYFANDGGVYRVLDGYTELTSGDCSTANGFQSLNQTLGSMTQFVSLAQHTNDANTLLGGTQGNGSPATANALGGTPWTNVNSGDGGYSAIVVNPDLSTEWFTENTGVSIQSCTQGVACRAGDFHPVVTSATLAGDNGPLYAPYLLDPQSLGTMIVGTCRVWRGSTSGSDFIVLSPNFETSTSTTCTGSEVNTVRSLAVGGTVVSGVSGVIYAGTDGTGPSAKTPAGGRLWVMTTAPNGTTTWTDRTQSINPKHYPISGIAIDSSDPTGNTAYVGLMGFGSIHIWQTRNAGVSWSAFENASSALPNVPVNTVIVDDGTVYLGTDLGVFASSTTRIQWVELGTSPGGFMPNVSVTALGIFYDGTTKLLRAATYGRGVWQYPLVVAPDFQIAVPHPEETTFAGQAAAFNGFLSAWDGYASQVQLSCVPALCSPATIAPSASGAPFTMQTSAPLGDYLISLQGVGQDASAITHTAALKLHVIDFTLSAPSPAAITLLPGQTSDPISLQLNIMGSLSAGSNVQLSCAAQANVNCVFSPASFSVSSGVPVDVSLTVTAAASAQAQNSSIDITAVFSAGATKTLHQPLMVSVITAGYALALNRTTLTLPARQGPVLLTGTATAANGYNSAVKLSCLASVVSGPGPAPSCAIDPTVTPTSSGQNFQITVGGGTAGSYSLNIQGTGSDADAIKQDAPLTANFYDFTVTPAPQTQSVPGGQTATYTLTVTPLVSTTFAQPVSFACAQLPTTATCSFIPKQINPGDPSQPVQLTISTTKSMAWSGIPLRPGARAVFYAMLLPASALVLACAGLGKTPRRRNALHAVLGPVVLFVVLQSGCGGGLSGGTTPPPIQNGGGPTTYPFSVTVTEGSGAQALQPAQPVQLTLVVQ